MLASYRMLWALLDRGGRLRVSALASLMLLAALIEAFAVASVLPFLSGLSNPGSFELPAGLGSMLGAGWQQRGVLALAVLFCLAVVLAIALKALADYSAMAFSSSQSARWSRNLLLVHLNKDYDWFLGEHSAKLGYGLLGRVQEVVNGSLLPALRLLVNALAAVALCAVLLRSMPAAMFLVFGGLVAVYSAVFVLMRRRFQRLGAERESVAALRYRLTSDVLGGIKEIKLHGLEAGYDARVRVPFERHAQLYAQRYLFSILPRYVLEALGFVTICVVVVVLGSGAGGLQGVVPVLGLFGFAAFRLLPAVQQVYQNAVSLPMGLAGLQALHDELANGNVAVPQAAAPMAMTRDIALQGVTYCYPGTTRPAIDGLNLSLRAGSMVALVGRSGAGKSTIADFSMGLLTPAAGTLQVDGMALDHNARRSWQAACSYVAQQVFLLDDSIAANIAFGLPPAARDMERVRQAARSAALHDFIVDALPAGYDTRIGERGARLSGGQRQRIGIARALYRESSYIVLDEATNALDTGTEGEVLAALDAIRGTRTLLVIAHRLATVAQCDRVLLVENGQLVADGDYATLLRTNAAFRSFAQAGTADALVADDLDADGVAPDATDSEAAASDAVGSDARASVAPASGAHAIDTAVPDLAVPSAPVPVNLPPAGA